MTEFIEGRPCKNCGSSIKYKTGGDCVSCAKKRAISWGKTNLKKRAKTVLSWSNRNRDKKSKSSEKWRKANPERGAFDTNLRRSRKLNATPYWITVSQKQEILEKYTQAKRLTMMTGILYHVDHIEPLKGKYVCGLHVPWNLQLLSYEENAEKGNRPQ